MSFSFNPANDNGKIRLLLHDTTTGTYGTDYLLSDEDISGLLEQNGDDVWLAAADGCRVLAARVVSSAYSVSIGGAINVNKTALVNHWLSLAAKYEARSAGVIPGGGGMLGGLREYIDSYAQGVDGYGRDTSEYVGDD